MNNETNGPAMVELLSSAERVSHLAKALHDLLSIPMPPEALPALAAIASVIYLESSQSAESVAEHLGSEAMTPERGPILGRVAGMN